MDALMREAYGELEEDMRNTLKAHRGSRSVLSTMLNTLLLYPDQPYGVGPCMVLSSMWNSSAE
jgi:hypothetical protein